MRVHLDELFIFVVGYYLLWCGTGGTMYSSFSYDNIQRLFPFVGYYGSKVCITLLQQICVVLCCIVL